MNTKTLNQRETALALAKNISHYQIEPIEYIIIKLHDRPGRIAVESFLKITNGEHRGIYTVTLLHEKEGLAQATVIDDHFKNVTVKLIDGAETIIKVSGYNYHIHQLVNGSNYDLCIAPVLTRQERNRHCLCLRMQAPKPATMYNKRLDALRLEAFNVFVERNRSLENENVGTLSVFKEGGFSMPIFKNGNGWYSVLTQNEFEYFMDNQQRTTRNKASGLDFSDDSNFKLLTCTLDNVMLGRRDLWIFQEYANDQEKLEDGLKTRLIGNHKPGLIGNHKADALSQHLKYDFDPTEDTDLYLEPTQ